MENTSRRFSMAIPAMVEKQTATKRIGADSRTTWRRTGRRARQPATRERTAAALTITPSTSETTLVRTAKVASHRAGMVRTSPRVETRGAVTLSRSHP